MNEMHKCYEEDDGIRISKVHYFSYWVLEWNFEDGNDPCYGSLIITYCPFCGDKLDVQEVQKDS